MSGVWVVVLVVGALTVAIKSAGPLALGGRPLPPRISEMLSLLPPALLAALVVTQVFASGRHLALDARAAALVVAAGALAARVPLLAVAVLAAATAALLRLI